MITYSAGQEFETARDRQVDRHDTVFSACEGVPDARKSIETKPDARVADDFVDYEHISVRVDANIHLSGMIKSVCGADDRVAVVDSTVYPHASVCFLESVFWDGTQEKNFIGTGFLYSATAVYTAAHCIHDHEWGYARRIRVSPGRNGRGIPFGQRTSSTYYVPPEWVANHGANHDYGAIVLPEPGFTHSQWFGMEARPAKYLAGERVRTSGYPADKPYGTQWTVEGNIATVAASRFFYMIDTMGGQSGSPVYTIDQHGFGSHFALGIHAYGGCPNGSSRVTREMIERLPTRA